MTSLQLFFLAGSAIDADTPMKYVPPHRRSQVIELDDSWRSKQFSTQKRNFAQASNTTHGRASPWKESPEEEYGRHLPFHRNQKGQ